MAKARAGAAGSGRRSPQALLAAAEQAERGGDLQEASRLYSALATLQRRDPALMYKLASLARARGAYDEAVDWMRKVVRLVPRDAALRCNLGNLHRERGAADQAIPCYRAALEIQPGHVNARFNLAACLSELERDDESEPLLAGIARDRPEDLEARDAHARCLLRLGRLDAAREAVEAMHRSRPGFAPAWLTAGELHERAGRPEQAEAAYRRAAELAPDDAAVWNGLAGFHLRQGRAEEALAAVDRILAAAPADAQALVNRGAALRHLHRHEEALAAGKQAVQLHPDSLRATLLVARCLNDLDSPRAAASAFTRCLQLDPGNVEARYELAALCITMEDHEEALRRLEELLAEHPEHAGAWSARGVALLDLGRMDEALRCFARALECDPDLPDPWLHAARFDRLDLPLDEAETRLRERVAAAAPHDETLAKRHFALARILDHRRSHEDAFAHYRAAKDILREIRPFDAAAHAAHVDRIIEVFDEGFVRGFGGGSDSEVPAFIVGMPRSGTTLVEQILASHSRIHGAGELTWMPDLAVALGKASPDGLRYPACVRALGGAQAGEIAADYVARLQALDPAALRVVDKLPGNFLHLGLVAMLFPRARVVHCRRNPMEVCLSNYTQWFAAGHRYTHGLEHLAAYYREYLRLMRHWRATLPLAVLDLHYERVVADQEGQSRRLVEFMGLEWEPACLDFHRHQRAVHTASHLQVRKPIYSSSVDRWRRYGPGLAPLREALADELAEYERDIAPAAS